MCRSAGPLFDDLVFFARSVLLLFRYSKVFGREKQLPYFLYLYSLCTQGVDIFIDWFSTNSLSILKFPYQNAVSQVCYFVEIHHSDPEPLMCTITGLISY